MSLGIIARGDLGGHGCSSVANMMCSVNGCARRANTRGWCKLHYQRWLRKGDPGPAQSRFLSPGVCSVPGCEQPRRARGYCKRHYWGWFAHGDPLAVGDAPRSRTPEQRFLALLNRDAPNGCWEWLGTRNAKGYGMFSTGDPKAPRMMSAHRWSYRHWVGPLPAGDRVLDHICRNRPCCNPKHLRVVTWRTNALLGEGPTAINARKTHCVNGHEFTPDNTKPGANGSRVCRACHRERNRAYKARIRGGSTR